MPLSNPIIANSAGRFTAWIDGSYKIVITDAAGVQIDTRDNVTSFVAGTSTTIDINGLTENTSAALNDYLPSYDTSAMANRKISFANIIGLIGPVINGMLPSGITGTNTTGAVTISPGSAVASNATTFISGAGYAWSVSNGNNINGYQGGTTLPNTTTIHFFVSTGASGTGSFASTSLTPTLPTGYDVAYRRIFSLFTNSTGALVSGVANETEGGSLTFYLSAAVNDVNATVPTTRTGYTVSVPNGLKFELIARMWQPQAITATIAWFSPDESDFAPTAQGVAGGLGYDSGSGTGFAGGTSSTRIITNTSSMISGRASVAVTGNLVTRGWKDFRRS